MNEVFSTPPERDQRVNARRGMCALAVLVAFPWATMGQALGQDAEPYVFRHVPEGVRITWKGERMMAYDLEAMRELARIDASLYGALAELEALHQEHVLAQKKLILLGEQLRLQTEARAQFQEAHESCIDALNVSMARPAPVAADTDVVIAFLTGAGITLIVGGILYAFAP